MSFQPMKNLLTVLVVVLLMGGATTAWAQEKLDSPQPIRDWAAGSRIPWTGLGGARTFVFRMIQATILT